MVSRWDQMMQNRRLGHESEFGFYSMSNGNLLEDLKLGGEMSNLKLHMVVF